MPVMREQSTAITCQGEQLTRLELLMSTFMERVSGVSRNVAVPVNSPGQTESTRMVLPIHRDQLLLTQQLPSPILRVREDSTQGQGDITVAMPVLSPSRNMTQRRGQLNRPAFGVPTDHRQTSILSSPLLGLTRRSKKQVVGCQEGRSSAKSS